jgi:glycosyltransferase involved in cell wall biosynthesis
MPRRPTKVLVLAHVPPPFHGQSLMVALMLEALRREASDGSPLQVFHVDSRYANDLSSLGRASFAKLAAALRYALRAIRLRRSEGLDVLYYVPAPGKRVALWRDWIVLGLVRPFFPAVCFHWHASGLAPWLAQRATAVERALSCWIYGGASLSVVLAEEKREEVAYFRPHAIEVIPNGIPDPCPAFETDVLPFRRERAAHLARFSTPREGDGACLRLLFLSVATREKGVFDALAAWAEINRRLAASGCPDVCSLTVVGEFLDPREQREFLRSLDAAHTELRSRLGEERLAAAEIRLTGHLSGEAKSRAYAEADLFLFPSRLPWESFPLVLVEAAHFGLPCLSYLPLIGTQGLSAAFHRRVQAGDTRSLSAEAIALAANIALAAEIRAEALQKFNLHEFGRRMAEALRRADRQAGSTATRRG